eukprot:552257_1
MASETNNDIDMNLFNHKAQKCTTITDKNIIDNCQSLQRLVYGLKCYNNKEKEDKQWIEFCTNIYAYQMLDDYSHLLSIHYDNVEEIKNELVDKYGFEDCLIKNCEFTSRHFNRNVNEKLHIKTQDDNAACQINVYGQEYDSFHFNLFHLFEVGYRFRKQDNDPQNSTDTNDNNDNDKRGSCVDHDFAKMMKKINTDRDKYKNIFQRFNIEKNNN